MKKLLLPLFVVLVLLAACSQQATEESLTESTPMPEKAEASEAASKPLSDQSSEQTPEPTAAPTPEPYAVSGAFVDEVTSNIA